MRKRDFVASAWCCLLEENEFDAERDWLGMFGGPCEHRVFTNLQSLMQQARAGPGNLAERIASGSESAPLARL